MHVIAAVITWQAAVVTDARRPVGACRALFVACEHFWAPVLLLRVVLHRFAATRPAAPLPPTHAHVLRVLHTWLAVTATAFRGLSEEAVELHAFCRELSARGGEYAAAAAGMVQRLQPRTLRAAASYTVDYAAADHHRLYAVLCPALCSLAGGKRARPGRHAAVHARPGRDPRGAQNSHR